MVDPAKALSLSNTTSTVAGTTVVTGTSVSQSGRVLQDAYVVLTASPTFAVEVGQQKVPLSLEGVQSSGKLETVERALFMTDKARGAGFGDVRDLGAMVRGKTLAGQIEYAGGVFNGLGESMNDVDKNNQKDVVTRVVLRPRFVKGLQFGGSAARDAFGAATTAPRQREGIELLYTLGPWAVKSEAMFGRDNAINRRGGYVQVTDRVRKSLQTLFRADVWDPDTSTDATAATVGERDWLGGVNYFITPSGVTLQLNYARKTFAGVAPSRDVFMANLQTAW
jgi:phosphate-selective porin